MKSLIPSLARNPVSFAGAALVTLSALLFLFVFVLESLGLHTNPYIGMVFFLIIPGIFLLGLLLIPFGMYREHRARLAGHPRTPGWPMLNLNDRRQLRIAALVIGLTIVNVFIVALAAFQGVHYMDSVQFCGQVCHEVMQPEFASYQAGPHARVACVQCHIGPGAPWFVRSKLSGLRQVYAVTFNTHSRPIPSPVHNLRPARDTCEECHWPEKFHGDRIRAFREYAGDAANTESVTIMRIHVGGGSESVGRVMGIHWHTSRSNRIEYIATDDKRQVIPWVRLTQPNGVVKEWMADGVSTDALAKGERRTMDCVDCHNRPSHTFAPSAERAIDEALARGVIDRNLPFIRREAVRVLKEDYANQDAAFAGIKRGLEEFYRTNDPSVVTAKRSQLARAIQVAQRLYARNVFPSMNVKWGTYANNVGHMNFPGCFRCHDESHKAKDGSTISQDCELCHKQEEVPAPDVAALD